MSDGTVFAALKFKPQERPQRGGRNGVVNLILTQSCGADTGVANFNLMQLRCCECDVMNVLKGLMVNELMMKKGVMNESRVASTATTTPTSPHRPLT